MYYMSRYDDIITRLEELESYVYNEIDQLIHGNLKNNGGTVAGNGKLIKYKPSKHQKAYKIKIDRNFKKRCYTR